jgi:hypothetical protein
MKQQAQGRLRSKWRRRVIVGLFAASVLLLLVVLTRLHWAAWLGERLVAAQLGDQAQVELSLEQMSWTQLGIDTLAIRQDSRFGIERMELQQMRLEWAWRGWSNWPEVRQVTVQQLDVVAQMVSQQNAEAAEPLDWRAWLAKPERLIDLVPLQALEVSEFNTRIQLGGEQIQSRGRILWQVEQQEQQARLLIQGELQNQALQLVLAAGPGQLGGVLRHEQRVLLLINHASQAAAGSVGQLQLDVPGTRRVLIAYQQWLPAVLRQPLVDLNALALQRGDLNMRWDWPQLPQADLLPRGQTEAGLVFELSVAELPLRGELDLRWGSPQQERAITLDLALKAEASVSDQAWSELAWSALIAQPESLRLDLQVAAQSSDAQLWRSVQAALDVKAGDWSLAVEGSNPSWQLGQPLNGSWLLQWQLQSGDISSTEWALSAASSSGQMRVKPAELAVSQVDAIFQSGSLAVPELGEVSGLQVQLHEAQWAAQGPWRAQLDVEIAQSEFRLPGHSSLRWRDHQINAVLNGDDEGLLTAETRLRLAAGELGAEMNAQRQPSQAWQGDFVLQRLNFLQGDEFLKRLMPVDLWPALLSIERGNLGLRGDWGWSADDWHVDGLLDGQQIKLVYDTTLLESVAIDLPFQVSSEAIVIAPATIRADAVNPGVALTQVAVDGAWRSSWQWQRGRLAIEQVSARLAGGDVSLEPFEWSPGSPRWQTQLVFQGLDLAALLALQGDTEIRGDGTLDGAVPLSFDEQGLQVADGRLVARPPGGRLSYQGAAAEAGQSGDQRSQLVFRALSDFRFDELVSGVDYQPDGTLRLNVRLFGRNPAVQNGHPINFNLNLEQSLPALLQSLQLANRVNEEIERRIREKL